MNEKARRNTLPNQVRYPTDWLFTSSCSPPHLTVTQLLSVTEPWLTPTRTFTVLLKRLSRRTHPGEGRDLMKVCREFVWDSAYLTEVPAFAGMTVVLGDHGAGAESIRIQAKVLQDPVQLVRGVEGDHHLALTFGVVG